MRKYRVQPHALKSLKADDDYWTEPHNTAIGHLTVYENEPGWVSIGILGPDGEPIQGYVGSDPVGFLWHLHEGEGE